MARSIAKGTVHITIGNNIMDLENCTMTIRDNFELRGTDTYRWATGNMTNELAVPINYRDAHNTGAELGLENRIDYARFTRHASQAIANQIDAAVLADLADNVTYTYTATEALQRENEHQSAVRYLAQQRLAEYYRIEIDRRAYMQLGSLMNYDRATGAAVDAINAVTKDIRQCEFIKSIERSKSKPRLLMILKYI